MVERAEELELFDLVPVEELLDRVRGSPAASTASRNRRSNCERVKATGA